MKRVLLALGVIAMTCATDAHADEGVTIAQFYSYCKKGPSHVDGAYCAGYMTGYADLGMIGRSTEVYGVAASIRYLRRELLARSPQVYFHELGREKPEALDGTFLTWCRCLPERGVVLQVTLS